METHNDPKINRQLQTGSSKRNQSEHLQVQTVCQHMESQNEKSSPACSARGRLSIYGCVHVRDVCVCECECVHERVRRVRVRPRASVCIYASVRVFVCDSLCWRGGGAWSPPL